MVAINAYFACIDLSASNHKDNPVFIDVRFPEETVSKVGEVPHLIQLEFHSCHVHAKTKSRNTCSLSMRPQKSISFIHPSIQKDPLLKSRSFTVEISRCPFSLTISLALDLSHSPLPVSHFLPPSVPSSLISSLPQSLTLSLFFAISRRRVIWEGWQNRGAGRCLVVLDLVDTGV